MDISTRARAFMAAIVMAGSAILVASGYELVTATASWSWLLLVACGAVTGSFMIKLPRIETRFSLSDALVFTSLLILGPACAAVVAAVDALAASLRFNKRDDLYASRTLFNATAAAVSVGIPGQAFLAAGGHALAGGEALQLRTVALPLLVFLAGYSLLNTGAIATVVALTTRARIAAVWRDNFAWLWTAHAWSGLAAGALAIYVPHVNGLSLLVIVAVGGVGYATVRIYVRQVEESVGHVHKLNDLYLATIQALAMAIDAKDQVTHGHIRRVQAYAVGLARALGVADEGLLKGIEAGALLHDTGKIAVPEHILNKPGKLTPQEYERMKTHVTIGADILSGIDFPYPVIPFVRHHHENWDGTGYPDGLRGPAIPLGARILSVVDCFDALTSDRPYRGALTTEVALGILRERSGTMYDPAVVAKFLEIHAGLTAALDAEAPRAGVADPPAARPPEAADFPAGAVPDTGELALFEGLGRLIAAGLAADEAAFVLTNRLRRCVRFTTAAVYAPRLADDLMDVVHVSGRHAELFRRSAIRLTQGLSGWVAAHGQSIVNADPALDMTSLVPAGGVPLKSALVVPFALPGGIRGALALYADEPDAFTLEHARLAAGAAAHLSRAFRPGAAATAQSERSHAA